MIWKQIPGYENLYECSSSGKVRSVDRFVVCKDGSKMFKRGQILKERLNINGYYEVGLWKENKRKGVFIHRVVAETFIDKTSGEQVNHINGNRLDNRVDNLEWTTPSENTKHSYDKNKRVVNRRGAKRRKVQVASDNGTFICNSIEETSRVTGDSPTRIRYLLSSGKVSKRGFKYIEYRV